jgi:hypothetical protein
MGKNARNKPRPIFLFIIPSNEKPFNISGRHATLPVIPPSSDSLEGGALGSPEALAILKNENILN